MNGRVAEITQWYEAVGKAEILKLVLFNESALEVCLMKVWHFSDGLRNISYDLGLF